MKKVFVTLILAILASFGVTITLQDNSPIAGWTMSALSARSMNAEV